MGQPKKGHMWSRKNIIIMTQLKRQATKEPSVTHEHLHHIYGERGEKENHKLESLHLSRKDDVTFSRLRNGHHRYLKYWLHKISTALDNICRKCGMGEETGEHTMGECPQIHRRCNCLLNINNNSSGRTFHCHNQDCNTNWAVYVSMCDVCLI